MNVFGLGNALVDSEYVVTDEALVGLDIDKGLQVLIDEERLAHILSVMSQNSPLGGELHKQASGGSAGNTIMAAQQFGASTAYACRVANDPIGKFFCEDMRTGGVEIDTNRAIMPQGYSGQCMVLVTPEGQRTMSTYLGVSSELSIENINDAWLEKAEYLYLEGYMAALPNSVEAACHAKTVIRRAGGKVALSFSDPSMTKFCLEGLQAIVNHGDSGIDILICNEDEAMGYTGTSDVEAAIAVLSKVSSNLVVTRGKHGAIALVNGESYASESRDIKVLNTNGAGDAFAGAYLYAMSAGWDVPQALKLANETARLVVAQYGPRLTQETQAKVLSEVKP